MSERWFSVNRTGPVCQIWWHLVVKIKSADIQVASSIFRDVREALEAVAEQLNSSCRKMVALHPGSHRGAAKRYL